MAFDDAPFTAAEQRPRKQSLDKSII